MLNTIKMDLYRMLKTKVFYVTIIITVISVILSICSVKYLAENPEYLEKLNAALEETSEIDLNVGIQMGNVAITTADSATEDIFMGIFVGGVFLLMGVIFCVVFVCTEHNSGYIKNVVSRKGYRSQMSASKSITMVIYTLVQFAVSIVIFLLIYSVLFDGLHFLSVGNFLRYLGMQAIVQIGLMNLCIFFCNIVRNMAFSMAFGICVSAGLFSLITTLIDKFNLPFNTTDYLLSILMKKLPMAYDNTLYVRTLIISIISIVAYQVASLFVMKKQDIK